MPLLGELGVRYRFNAVSIEYLIPIKICQRRFSLSCVYTHLIEITMNEM